MKLIEHMATKYEPVAKSIVFRVCSSNSSRQVHEAVSKVVKIHEKHRPDKLSL